MLLEVSNLSVSFQSIYGYAHILDHISISVDHGEIIGIVGESGSGKSVTALSILQLLSDNAVVNEGTILYNGINLLDFSEAEIQKIRGQEIAMVFQEPMTSLNPTIRIGKQIANVIKTHHNVSKKESEEKAIQSLLDVKIPNAKAVSQKYPFQLSGGMRQRVVIALAMSAPPNLLIADEPTTALDVTVQNEILKLMKDLSIKKGTSILFISHDLGVVANLCHRVYVMYGGKVVESGTTQEVLYHPKHPYTKGLILSNPEGKDKDEPLNVIEGEGFNPKKRPPGCVFYDRCPGRTNACLQIPPIVKKSNTHWVACWEAN